MNERATKLARNASTAVVYPIVGMLGGLFVGGLRARVRGAGEIDQIAFVVKWGITGFFAGLALVVLLASSSRGENIVSMRRLMVLVVVAGLLTWFFARIFAGVIGNEGF
jgi:hypothetical protein